MNRFCPRCRRNVAARYVGSDLDADHVIVDQYRCSAGHLFPVDPQHPPTPAGRLAR